MEVTFQGTELTSYIVGGQDTVGFTAQVDANLLHNLSKNLYKFQLLAALRETLCNAWDSHIASDIKDTPIEVTISKDEVIIRDYGAGIPVDQFYEIFGTFGRSTKQYSTNETGGFGYGSKAPFAYTDVFYVTNYRDGKKYRYVMNRVSTENSLPGMTLLNTHDTVESGVEVTIPLLPSEQASSRVINLIRELISFGGMNGKVIISDSQKEEIISSIKFYKGITVVESGLYNPSIRYDRILVRYGSVVYPVPRSKHYDKYYHKIDQTLDKHLTVILEAEPNTLAITPSREGLSLQSITEDTLLGLLKNANQVIQNLRIEFKKELKEEEINILKSSKDPAKIVGISIHNYRGNHKLKTMALSNLGYSSVYYGSEDIKSLIKTKVQTGMRILSEKEVRNSILNHANSKSNTYSDKKFLRRHILNPLIDLSINLEKVSIMDTRCITAEFSKDRFRNYPTLQHFFTYTCGTRNASARLKNTVVCNSLTQLKTSKEVALLPEILIVIVVPRKVGDYKSLVADLSSKGFNVWDITEPKESTKRTTKRISTPKVEGYMDVHQAPRKRGFMNYPHIFNRVSVNAYLDSGRSLISNPSFYVPLPDIADSIQGDHEILEYLLEKRNEGFGALICNKTQLTKAIDEGIPHYRDFFFEIISREGVPLLTYMYCLFRYRFIYQNEILKRLLEDPNINSNIGPISELEVEELSSFCCNNTRDLLNQFDIFPHDWKAWDNASDLNNVLSKTGYPKEGIDDFLKSNEFTKLVKLFREVNKDSLLESFIRWLPRKIDTNSAVYSLVSSISNKL